METSKSNLVVINGDRGVPGVGRGHGTNETISVSPK